MIWKTFPYSHAFWSAVISLVVLALVYLDLELLAGAVFYGAREVYQWKIEGRKWDWPGFWWGVLPMTAVTFALVTA